MMAITATIINVMPPSRVSGAIAFDRPRCFSSARMNPSRSPGNCSTSAAIASSSFGSFTKKRGSRMIPVSVAAAHRGGDLAPGFLIDKNKIRREVAFRCHHPRLFCVCFPENARDLESVFRSQRAASGAASSVMEAKTVSPSSSPFISANSRETTAKRWSPQCAFLPPAKEYPG